MGKAFVAIGCALVLGLGCTDDTQAGRASSEPVEKKIHAAQGGTLSAAGVKAKIPADALGKDVTLSVEIVSKDGLPNPEKIGSGVFDFGPDGIKFEKPVSLTLDFDPKRIPDGMHAVIAFLNKNKWVVLDDSMVKGNSVVATTTHFTPFAVIFVAGAQPAGACSSQDEFEACGGDLIGTWEFTLGCVTLPADLFSRGPFAMCDGLIVNANIDLGGTINFGEDGVFDLEQTSDTKITLTIPKTCVTDESCAALAPPEDAGVTGIVVSEQGDNCVQVQDTSSQNVQHGTYVVDGKSFTTVSDDGQESDPTEYCVAEDEISSKVVTSSGQTLIYRATRKN